MVSIGFIHDLGKIMTLPEFGGLPQWSVVGDTFPLHSKLSPTYEYYHKYYHLKNRSIVEEKNKPYIGFDKLVFSWGHDDYLASVLTRNKTKLPAEAIYIIKYHSFYSWHSPKKGIRGYTHLASDWDWYMLPLLKAFQKADLYSKTRKIPDMNEIRNEYNELLKKYFNSEYFYW